MKERQRAVRREPDHEAVLEKAIEMMLAEGEKGFRIEKIIEATGISKSSLYLHFGGRDGLIEAASLEIFTREVIENIDRTIGVLNQVSTREEASNIIGVLLGIVYDQQESVRWNRVMVLAASRYRPQLELRLSEAQTKMNDDLEVALQRWYDIGMLRQDVVPRDVATVMQVMTFGRLFRDLDLNKETSTRESWLTMQVVMHQALLAD